MDLNILVCVKRVPAPGAKMTLTADEQQMETRFLGFAISPHEECAAEAAVQLVDEYGGKSAVLTLGTDESLEQLRYCMAMGIDRAILLEREGDDWDAMATSRAIIDAVKGQQAAGEDFNLLLFGNESADSGGYQVGIRVAHALGMPCVAGIKALEIQGDVAVAKREIAGGWEIFEVPLPAVFTVKEGINLPRYPSVPGRLKAKKKPVDESSPTAQPGDLTKVRLRVPEEQSVEVQILGHGPDAAPKVIEVMQELGVL